MTDRPPNIIFISVDALRYDRLSVNGYDRPTTPTLERLASSSIICDNQFALNASTMGAFPTILCSCRPLSNGGFDFGAANRPPSIFQQFQSAGYRTHMLSTVHWVNQFFGYGDGLDSEEMLFSLGSLIGTAGALTRTTLERYNTGNLSSDEMREHVTPILAQSLERLEVFAKERICRFSQDRANFRHAPFFADGFNYERVLGVIQHHRTMLANDSDKYLARYVPKPFRAGGWLTPEWQKSRTMSRLMEEAVERIYIEIVRLTRPAQAFLRKQRYKRYPDAEALIRHVLAKAKSEPGDKPFFIWTHLFDTHLPYCAGSHPDWYHNTRKHLRALDYNPSIDPGATFGAMPSDEDGRSEWSALYDAAIHFVDGALAQLVSGLQQNGLDNNTLIAICGDHGEELGENGDYGHHFRLYGYNTHVPFMIHGPGIKEQRVGSMTSHLDLAPTLADIAGIAPNADWEGAPAHGDEVTTRDHILMETFFGSPCDFENRPLYFAVRNRDFHLMWKERCDPTDHLSPEGNQLYDVHTDSEQLNNIYDNAHPAVINGKKIIAKRMAELPELSEERYAHLIDGMAVNPEE